MRKRLFYIILTWLIGGLSVITLSCKKESVDSKPSDDTQAAVVKEESPVKVGLVMAETGPGDISYTDMQYIGLERAEKLYNIEYVYMVPEENTIQAAERIIRDLAQQKCKLIFTSFYFAIEAVKNVAHEFPDIRFVILDYPVTGIANVTSAVYAQHEGSFVVGYLAAKFSQTKNIGFIGGVDIPVIKAFLKGFEEGLAYSRVKTSLKVEYLSRFPEFSGFNSPDKAYLAAVKMYDQGIDVIYNVAGLSGAGIIKAAGDRKKYVIGVDTNQDGLGKGYVLTSMIKRLDYSVVDIVDLYIKGELKTDHVYEYNYKNFGISITDMKYTRDIIGEPLIQELGDIEMKIVNDQISVTNTLIEH